MKKSILIFLFNFLYVVASSCKAQDVAQNCHYNDSIFKLNSNEKFFIEENYKIQYKSGYGDVILEDKNYRSSFRKKSSLIRYEQIDKQINILKNIDYYLDGKIKSLTTYYTYDNGIEQVGIEYFFDSKGNIEKEINYDKGYKVCWSELIPILKKDIGKRNFEKYEITIQDIDRTDLSEYPNEKAEWVITVSGNKTFKKKNKGGGLVNFKIDGNTGEIIKKSAFNLID